MPGDKIAMFRSHVFTVLCICLFSTFTIHPAYALEEVYSFHYQAKLTNGSGIPLNGSHTLFFSVIQGGDALNPGSGTVVYAEYATVNVTDGSVNYAVGSGTPFTGTLVPNIFVVGNTFYLQVAVDASTNIILPRAEITRVPMALKAASVPFTGIAGMPVDLGDGASVANVKTVAKSGGQFTSIQAALNSITDSSPANPYLIKVAPGTYVEKVTMKPGIRIEGSGPGATTVTLPISNVDEIATIVTADYSELHDVSVTNDSDTVQAIGVQVFGETLIRDVIVTLTAESDDNVGIQLDGDAAKCTAHLQNITVSMIDTSNGVTGLRVNGYVFANISNIRAELHSLGACNGIIVSSNAEVYVHNAYVNLSSPGATVFGLLNGASYVKLDTCTIRARGTGSYGILNYGFMDVVNSLISAEVSPVSAYDYAIRLVTTGLEGPPVVVSGGTATCTYCYDEFLAPSQYPNCP